MSNSQYLLKTRAFFWLISALIKRYHNFLFFGFSIGLALFIGLVFATPLLRTHINSIGGPRIKKIAIIGSFTPTNFPLKIQKLISYGLTDLTPSGEATPEAASTWDIEDEGKLYRFHLKKDLFWQNGREFKAADVNYNLKDAALTVIDDSTIEIRLKESFSPLPILLAQPLFQEGLLGLGEYKVNSLELKEGRLLTILLEPTRTGNNLPNLKYHFYPAKEEAILAYKLGEVDMIEDLDSLDVLIDWPVRLKATTAANRYVGLFYNLEDQFLSSKTVRQALTFALPELTHENIAYSSINPRSWAFSDKFKKYEFDPGLSQKLLKQGVGTESAKPKLTLSTLPVFENDAKQIVQSWRNIGLDADIKIEKEIPQKFQILLAAQEFPLDPDQYALWHSTQEKTNITHYKSPRIDKLLEDGRRLTDQGERKKKYLDFQKYLMDDLPAVFLYYPTIYTISRS